MKKVLLLLVSAMLILTAGCASNSSTPSEPLESEYIQRFNGDIPDNYSSISLQDADGNDISDIAIDLWFAVNAVYDSDDIDMFEYGKWVQLFEETPEFIELNNYDEVVDNIFTANGKMQLENTSFGGDLSFIQKQDGKVYRLGPWKTGYSYAFALADMQVKQAKDNSIVLEVTYEEPLGFIPDSEYDPTYVTVDFEIVQEDGVWKVENYQHPEAT